MEAKTKSNKYIKPVCKYNTKNYNTKKKKEKESSDCPL